MSSASSVLTSASPARILRKASTAWGGITGAFSGAFGALSAGTGFLVSGLGGLSIPTFVIAVPVFGGIGVITVGGIIVGITTAATFFNNEGTPGQIPTGDNEFFTIIKTANPVNLQNNNADRGAEITFTINLKAKVDLSSISLTDEINVNGKYDQFKIDKDINDNPVSPPCQNSPNPPPIELEKGKSWNCQFKINIKNGAHNFKDSIVTNLASVKATPEGSSQKADSASAFITIGNPEVSDPTGWPTCGQITQGPLEGGTHSDPLYGSAFDIDNGEGTRIYATHSGVVFAATVDHTGALYVAIKGKNYITYYVHLKYWDNSIKVGTHVTAGTLIGGMGKTGFYAVTNHLHYMFYDSNNQPLTSKVEINDLVPPYNLFDNVPSSWGPCP